MLGMLLNLFKVEWHPPNRFPTPSNLSLQHHYLGPWRLVISGFSWASSLQYCFKRHVIEKCNTRAETATGFPINEINLRETSDITKTKY